jgi:hypothetical protein
MKPGDIVANKHTGVRFVVVEVRGRCVQIQTKPGQRIRSVPKTSLRRVVDKSDESPVDESQNSQTRGAPCD